jgi:phosphopantothenoylcysteine decarboxylase/phosphopantothenate--cysteine ligase
MHREVLSRFEGADAVVMAAAVGDFRPVAPRTQKLKKEAGVPEIRLERTPDILKELGDRKGRTVLIGFAAETDDLEAGGRRKLEDKNLDAIVVNQVGEAGTGFDADTNRALILVRDGDDEPQREWTKRELAAAICDRLAKALSAV